MRRFKAFVNEMLHGNEMHGKGTIDNIGKHHSSLMKYDKTKRGSAANAYHSIQRDRASRLKNLRDKKIPAHHVAINKQYDHEDSKRAKELKARIKPSDYR